ncbi:uncharacterized protein [Eleutherodactylus coqui]|uniref:uncharacterized protein isoform X3 n=1 Tax=Eleutherodactylus coqui TaxID=57060 RepID=UPI0034632A70
MPFSVFPWLPSSTRGRLLLTSGIMLHICCQLLRRVAVHCSPAGHAPLRWSHAGSASLRWSHAGSASLRWFSVARPSHGQRDYSLPNATWSQNMRDLYRKYEELSKSGAWRRIPSYNSTVHHVADSPPEDGRVTRLFTRNLDQDGVGFEYSMFYSEAEKRIVCIFQPGPYLEGPPGHHPRHKRCVPLRTGLDCQSECRLAEPHPFRPHCDCGLSCGEGRRSESARAGADPEPR